LCFVAGWIVLLKYFSPAEIVEVIGVKNGYVLMFLVAALGGLSTLSSASFVAIVVTLSLGGLDPILLAVFDSLNLAFLLAIENGEYEFANELLIRMKPHISEEDFMDNLNNVQPATVGFKPVTNVGFATMLTGVDPILHGVHDRSYRELSVPSIFDYCNEMGITNGLIEGDVQILSLNTETILNVDENNNGITDDEIHQTALNKINDYEYLMVHYHSVDDFGHVYGAVVDETIGELKVIDGYVEELIAQWDGKVILLADHGMHSTEEAGDHGMFRIEDFVVPYVVLDGGLYEKE
jgi:hypothetical protein